ncbi:MAG: transglutaminase domain-containing protein [Lachnospiraceae bacterium]|nr:transglutaminase domain-containing protein [Lachnospiraceae bacterium]
MKKIFGIILALAVFAGIFPVQQTEAKTKIYPTVASGTLVKSTSDGEIDYSNTADGYVMVKYKKATSKTIKAQLVGPNGNTYTYTLRANKYEALPLTEGNGKYKVSLFLNVSGNSYAIVMSETISVTLSSQFAPYLRANQYVNFTQSTKFVKKAATLTKKCKNDIAKVKKVYQYVIKKFKYDKKKAQTVKAGYLPDLNKLYKQKKGICFDYAAVMTAMLRSQGVATKLVIGYTGNAYHAWINVYSKKKGWITGAIYFNGKKWKLMDPTFASTGKSSKSIMKYIGNGRNYKAKYSY